MSRISFPKFSLNADIIYHLNRGFDFVNKVIHSELQLLTECSTVPKDELK